MSLCSWWMVRVVRVCCCVHGGWWGLLGCVDVFMVDGGDC